MQSLLACGLPADEAADNALEDDDSDERDDNDDREHKEVDQEVVDGVCLLREILLIELMHGMLLKQKNVPRRSKS